MDGDRVLIRTFSSVLAVDSGSVNVILGSGSADTELPQVSSDGPFAVTDPATGSSFAAILEPYAFSVNDEGELLTASSGDLKGQEEPAFSWQVDGGEDSSAQEIADARQESVAPHNATLVVTPDGNVTTADIASYDAVWLDSQTIALSMFAGGESIIVTLDVPAVE
jgi:hypothetical protein